MLVSSALERHFETVLATGESFFAEHAGELANACWGMARRFHKGGKLLVYAGGGADFSDAQHNAVEFMHPVIVGKRALPAVSVRNPAHLPILAGPDDITMGVTGRTLEDLPGGLMVAFGDSGRSDALHSFTVGAGDHLVAQEIQETAYHELWELVHVFFEHEGLLAESCTDDVCITCGDVALQAAVVKIEGSTALVRTAQGEEEADIGLLDDVRPGELVLVHGGVALERVKPIDTFSQEFYPFLTNQAIDVQGVLADVVASVRMKWAEVAALRRATDMAQLREVLELLRTHVAGGAQVLIFGNGGSATDSADFAADLREIGIRAFDLCEEPALVSAVANDIGFDEIFARQVIALGNPGDVAVGISTSGRSGNVARGMQQARAQGLTTVALAGYGGGNWVNADYVDHLVITDSTYIPRIQEAQATIYHGLVRGLEEGS